MINSEKRDKALAYLAETDEPLAKARAYLLGLEKTEKVILGQEILEQKGRDGTVGEKDAKARTSYAYTDWLKKYEDAVLDYEHMKARRTTAALIIECWRSEFSARKQGIIT